jgi:hypothetical protein
MNRPVVVVPLLASLFAGGCVTQKGLLVPQANRNELVSAIAVKE